MTPRFLAVVLILAARGPRNDRGLPASWSGPKIIISVLFEFT